MEPIEGEEDLKIYQEWFGPESDVPYSMTPDVKTFLLYQVVPK